MIASDQTVNRPIGRRWHVPALLALVLIGMSYYSYLLFHTVLELLTVLIATAAFVVTWHTYDITRNRYLMILGCGYFWVGALDFVHTLAYRGMNVLPSILAANEPTQLWIAARYGEALLLLAAPLIATRAIRREWAFAVPGAIAAVLVASIMSGNFPDCFVEGRGLTPFKIYSEYVIIAILIGAMAHLWRRRGAIDSRIVAGILLANLFTIGAEISFTQYASVYGPANLVGHLFKLFAFWMIYSVLVEFAQAAALSVVEDAVEARRKAEAGERALRQRTAELDAANQDLARFNRVAVGRELQMIELKEQVNALCATLGQPNRYRIDHGIRQPESKSPETGIESFDERSGPAPRVAP